MPDVRDLLITGAGEPPAPLDMPAVLRRASQRTARRRAGLVAAAVLPVVAVAGVLLPLGGGTPDRLVPAAPTPAPSTAPVLPPTAPDLPPLPTAPDTTATAPQTAPPAAQRTAPPRPSASAPTNSAPPVLPRPSEVVDGTVYALITSTDGRTVTWDQVDSRLDTAACRDLQLPSTYPTFFTTCYSNTSHRLRTAPMSPTAPVRVKPGNAPERTEPASALPREIGASAGNDIPPAERTWQLTIRGGTVVAVEQGPAASA